MSKGLWVSFRIAVKRAFEVYRNGKKLCLVGVGDDGVLSAIVNWVARKGRGDLFLSVGGLHSPTNEHAKWVREHLHVGDEITVRIVETDSTDKPNKRYRTDPAEDLKYQKSQVRAMAKKLGWKIQTRAKQSDS